MVNSKDIENSMKLYRTKYKLAKNNAVRLVEEGAVDKAIEAIGDMKTFKAIADELEFWWEQVR